MTGLSGDLEIGVDKSFFQRHFRLPLPTSETSPWELLLTRLDKNSPFLPRLLGLCPVLNKKAQFTLVVYLSVPPTVVTQGAGVVDSSGHICQRCLNAMGRICHIHWF